MSPAVPAGQVGVLFLPAPVFAGADVAGLCSLELAPFAARSRFDDDVWDFTGWVDAPVAMWRGLKIFDFRSIINPRYRQTAKELIAALMAPRHERVLDLPGANRKPLFPSTCASYLRALKLWFAHLTEHGVDSLEYVVQEHCDEFLAVSSMTLSTEDKPSRPKEPGSYSTEVLAVQVLAVYGELFTADRYSEGFLPWQGRSADSVIGQKRHTGENKTQPLADGVLRPLVTCGLYIVQVLGPHAAALVEHVRSLPTGTATGVKFTLNSHRGGLHPWHIERIDEAIARNISREEPLQALDEHQIRRRLKAGWHPDDPLLQLNTAPLVGHAGLPALMRRHIEQIRPALEEAVARLGLSAPFGRDAAEVAMLHSEEIVPWTLPLHLSDLPTLSAVVNTAAMLLTCLLSGMRDSELRELVVGSRQPPAEVSGGGLRYRLSGKVVKGRGIGGQIDEWVVVAEVDQALALVEQLTGRERGESLFRKISFFDRYRKFRAWVNGAAGQRLGLPVIPAGPVNSRILRRTLAQELAYRPNGLMAAKVQLKHISVVTTEGYAARPGGAQAMFRAEVRELEEAHHLELTVAAFRDYQAGRLPAGPGAKGLIAAFEYIDAALKDHAPGDAKVLDNDRRIENMLRQQAGYLHLGAANYCWFRDRAKALCLKLAGTPDATKPVAGLCDSARCPQATHHPCHLPVWQSQVDSGEVFLGNPRVPKLEKTRLGPEIERARRVVDEISEAAKLLEGTG